MEQGRVLVRQLTKSQVIIKNALWPAVKCASLFRPESKLDEDLLFGQLPNEDLTLLYS